VRSFAWTALLLCAGPAASPEAAARPIAEIRAQPAPLTNGVLARLAARLEAIPKTWDRLPSPLVAVSGRSVEEALGAAAEEQSQEASRWLARLAAMPPEARPALIQAEIRHRSPTEVDLWLPGLNVRRMASLDDAAVLEAWLQWVEALGRKDALLAAASFAIDVLRTRQGAAAVLPILHGWAELPPVPGAERSQAMLQSSMAEVFFRLGENQEALDAQRTARERFLAANDPLGQADTWRGEAEILLRLGEKQQALDAYSKARPLLRAARQLILARTARRRILATWEQLELGHTWCAEADILFRVGETTKVLYAYGEARRRFLGAGDQLGQATTWYGEGNAFFRLGEDQKALDAYRKARELFIAVGDHAGQGDTWLGEAAIWVASLPKQVGSPFWERRKAMKAATAAIAGYQSAGVVPSQVSALLLRAKLENEPADSLTVWLRLASPLSSASEAIRLHSQERATWSTDRIRTEHEGTIRMAYDLLVPLRAREKGQAAEALRLAEEARSRVLLDLLATAPDRGESGPAAGLMEERHRLVTELWQIEERLRASPKLEQQQELSKRRQRLDQELEWNRYQRIVSQEESFPQERPLDTGAMQQLARETGPLLLYYADGSKVWGFLILPTTAEVFLQSIPISQSELGRRIRAFSHDLANPLLERRSEAYALQLWNLLIAPFNDRLPTSGHLVLVPHGPLHELPFEALRDTGGKRLFERWQISITPSVSALAFARRRHAMPLTTDSFLGFSSGRGLNLPAGEVAEISRFFGTGETAFHPTAANYQNYVQLAAQARHLLIATRGVHSEGSRTGTYLEIDPTPEVHDSRLTAAEIATIPLQAELVSLAACDTSHGRALLSDERLDLTRSFLIARAAAVLATRWKVPEDAATSRFLADFYRAYRRGGPRGTALRKDEALTEARRRSRERGDAAQVWAAWVLVGDAR
jgi:CHAT domain-containing protein